jgi:hypothetical protein
MTLSMASSTSWRLPASTVLPGPDSCASLDSLAVPRAAYAARREARRAPTLRKAKKRPDERTRTADLESHYECAVGRFWALQGFANSA